MLKYCKKSILTMLVIRIVILTYFSNSQIINKKNILEFQDSRCTFLITEGLLSSFNLWSNTAVLKTLVEERYGNQHGKRKNYGDQHILL